MTLKELMQQVLDLDEAGRLKLAGSSLTTMYEELEKCGVTGDKAGSFVIACIKTFVSADRSCSMEEYQFIKKLYNLDMSYDEFFDMTNHGADDDYVTWFDEMIDSFTEDGKYAVCTFGLCILTTDGTLTVEEQKLFARILA